jgi:hypothetical protein
MLRAVMVFGVTRSQTGIGWGSAPHAVTAAVTDSYGSDQSHLNSSPHVKEPLPVLLPEPCVGSVARTAGRRRGRVTNNSLAASVTSSPSTSPSSVRKSASALPEIARRSAGFASDSLARRTSSRVWNVSTRAARASRSVRASFRSVRYFASLLGLGASPVPHHPRQRVEVLQNCSQLQQRGSVLVRSSSVLRPMRDGQAVVDTR